MLFFKMMPFFLNVIVNNRKVLFLTFFPYICLMIWIVNTKGIGWSFFGGMALFPVLLVGCSLYIMKKFMKKMQEDPLAAFLGDSFNTKEMFGKNMKAPLDAQSLKDLLNNSSLSNNERQQSKKQMKAKKNANSNVSAKVGEVEDVSFKEK